MKIEKSTVEKIKITGAKNLDPVSVFLEDLEPGRGKITIECYGKSWSAYWGAMGKERTISQFFCDANTEYIVGYLDGQLRSVIYESYEDEEGTPNHHYEYLCRIVGAVKEALK